MTAPSRTVDYASPNQHARRFNLKHVLLWAFAGLLALALAVPFGLRYRLIGDKVPSTADYCAIAKKHQFIVQAIYDFRAERGLLPEDLHDLVPDYVPHVIVDPSISYDGNTLDIHAGVPHTSVSYSFRPDREGWFAGGDFA